MIRTFPHAKAEFYHNGLPVSGGTVKFFEAGTSTPKVVYSDYSRANSLGSEVTLDEQGRAYIVLGSGNYDCQVHDSNDVQLYSEENFTWDFFVTTSFENFICNPSFETDEDSDDLPDNWTINEVSGSTTARDTTDSNHGAASLKIITDGTANANAVSCIFPVAPNEEYLLSFYIKGATASDAAKVEVDWLDGDQASLSTSTVYDNSSNVPTSWDREDISITSVANAKFAQVVAKNAAVSGTVRFDGFHWRQTTQSGSHVGTVSGMRLSNNSSDSEHDIDISDGFARSEDGSFDIVISEDRTKKADEAWSYGNDAGMLDTGSLGADSMYSVWAIGSVSGNEPDYLASTSFTSPSMPSGYTKKRLIGVFWTDGSSNIYEFVHFETYFYLLGDIIEDVNDNDITNETFETATLRCPPNCIAEVYGRIQNEDTSNFNDDMSLWIRPKGGSEEAAGGADGDQEAFFGVDMGSALIRHFSKAGSIYVNSDSQVEYAAREQVGANDFRVIIKTRGCEMLTRNQPNV